MNDEQFVRSFTGMIIAFLILTVLLIILAIIVANPVMSKVSEAKNVDRDRQVAARVAPVGALTVGEPEAKETDSAEEVAAVEVNGEDVYNTACAACHATGVAGAPAFGDAAAWKDRLAQGAEVLNEHAINGYQGEAGYMPPKGGNPALTDEQVSAAVEHMTKASQ